MADERVVQSLEQCIKDLLSNFLRNSHKNNNATKTFVDQLFNERYRVQHLAMTIASCTFSDPIFHFLPSKS
jgi:hypothetical protein